ncbi:MAG TPA: hypothetical protein VND87_14325 [Stellaceae bacterium]|nr:hypothetical protein [Stellaceae bacterium]
MKEEKQKHLTANDAEVTQRARRPTGAAAPRISFGKNLIALRAARQLRALCDPFAYFASTFFFQGGA